MNTKSSEYIFAGTKRAKYILDQASGTQVHSETICFSLAFPEYYWLLNTE